jgi:hypothetical protein
MRMAVAALAGWRVLGYQPDLPTPAEREAELTTLVALEEER